MTLSLAVTFGLLIYAVAGYPLVLLLCSRPKRAECEDGTVAGSPRPPSVSLLLSVYNEEAVISRKLDNFLRLDYPRDMLELIVVSDGSTDATDVLVRDRADPGVILLRQEGRLGKSSALNLAAKRATGDILFFTDADSMLRPDCLTKLVRPFADPMVGLTSGRSLYLDEQGRETAGSLYRRCEEWIKEKEGELFGIVGADGAVYAMRRELFTPLDPACINDFLHPIQVVMAGRKALAVPDALIAEAGTNEDGRSELARQTRIMAQSWLICLRFAWPLLAAGRLGFLWQLFSHKVLRWLILPLLFLCALAALLASGPAAALILTGIGLFGLCAALGARGKGGLPGRIGWLFTLQGAAAMIGLLRLARGNRYVTWNPRGQ